MKTAYSYIRFSTPDQAKGDSYRRQSEKAEAWAAKHGYRIIKEYSDRGMSAFRSENSQDGKLAAFLRLVEQGEIDVGSVLIIESLDRFSRDALTKALPRFLDLINAGIGVVTLADERLYTVESINSDQLQLFASLIVMMRAHEESQRKSERVGEAWSAKRRRARTASEKLSDCAPEWLDVGRDSTGSRTFALNEVRVELVKRIFEETAQGYGRRMIAKRLNSEKKMAFRSGKDWHPSSIAKIVTNRAVLGEYQPHRRIDKKKRVKDGEAIEGYYPAIIDKGLWMKAQGARESRRTSGAGKPGKLHAETANLIRGIARCFCGERMEFINKGSPPRGGRYYVCSSAARSARCDRKRAWKWERVEEGLLYQLGSDGLQGIFEPAVQALGPSVQEYEKRIAELTRMRQRAIDLFLKNEVAGDDPQLQDRIDRLRAEIAEVEEQRDEAAIATQRQINRPNIQFTLDTVRTFAQQLRDSSADDRLHLRYKIMQQLRTVFTEIRFGNHYIEGLIELPGKPVPQRVLSPSGYRLVSPSVEMRVISEREVYYLRHMIYCDDPEYLYQLSDGPAKPGDWVMGSPARRG